MSAPVAQVHWVQRLWPVLFIIFCAEIGLFLLVFPWTLFWDESPLISWVPRLHGLWLSGYFRGAVSGIGLLNLYISAVEVFRLKRFAPRD